MFRFAEYLFVTVVAFLLVACGILPESCPPVKMSVSSQEYLEFVEQMLAAEENCLPPCWEGLVPGVATKADVLAALGNLSFVSATSIVYQEASEITMGRLLWSNTAPQSLAISGEARLDNEDVLTAVRFTADFDHPLLSLGTVIERFGEPDYYSVSPSHDFSCKWSRLVWPSVGLEIQTYAEESGENEQHLTENTAVASVIYFIPQETLEGYLRNIRGLLENQIQEHVSSSKEWTGFSDTQDDANK